jgi:hypothetical protein
MKYSNDDLPGITKRANWNQSQKFLCKQKFRTGNRRISSRKDER